MRNNNELSNRLVLDSCVREFIYLATGRIVPDDRPLNLNDLNCPITESLVRRLAVIGLSSVVAHARRGSLEAGKYLTDRALGVCDKPFREAVDVMDANEARTKLLQEFKEAGFSETIAAQITERLTKVEANG